MTVPDRPVEPVERPVWIGTSWKMTKTLAAARDFVDQIAGEAVPARVQPFVIPAHTALAAVRDRLPASSPVLLGAQNAHWAPEGAWTGEISMGMAADAGATLVELGHSERRMHFAETDETVALKAAAAVAHGLVPLICVGESRAVRTAGAAEDVIAGQVRAAMAGLSASGVQTALVAYEPIWAIGERGRPATAAEVGPVMRTIVRTVAELSDGGRLRALLYGGSVDVDNAATLLEDPHTDGLFVGRAAWSATGFLRLLRIAASD